MRSHEERVAAVRQRITQEEQKKRLRRSRMITACSEEACLVLIVGLSVLMPGILQNMSTDSYDGFAMAASMFGENEAIGYIIIGLLSFLLGVCVTILGFRIYRFQREDEEVKDDAGDYR